MYQTNILKALLYPRRSFFQLTKAEVIYGFWKRIFWLFLAGAFVFLVSGWFGIGTHTLSHELVQSISTYSGLKSFFITGRFFSGILYAALIIFLPALFYWMIVDVHYTKLALLQAFILPILLLEQVSFIILAIGFNLPWYSSPLSVGVIAQYITDSDFLIYMLASASLFKWWVIWMQYVGLRALTNQSKWLIALIVILFNLIGWAFTASLAFIPFTKIL